MLNTFKKLIEFLNKPRFIEITYGTYEDEDRYNQPIVKNLETIDYSKIALKLNKQNTKELIRAYIKKTTEKDGLLLNQKQLDYETEQTYKNYKNAGLIDLNCNLKIGVEEGIKEIINN